MTGIYKIAGKNIAVTSLYDNVHTLCVNYKTDGEPDFSVTVKQDDIDFERGRSDGKTRPDGYLETLAVYRKIAEKMPEYDTFLCHGSALSADGEGYLFTAPSGTGKSTHARLWRQLLGGRVVMINDDKPLIRIEKDGAFVCGTPWDGKHRLSADITVPLKAICFIYQAKENVIEQITPSDAYPALLRQIYRPRDALMLMKTLNLIDRLTASARLFRLGCNMDISAAELSYKTMKGSL